MCACVSACVRMCVCTRVDIHLSVNPMSVQPSHWLIIAPSQPTSPVPASPHQSLRGPRKILDNVAVLLVP